MSDRRENDRRKRQRRAQEDEPGLERRSGGDRRNDQRRKQARRQVSRTMTSLRVDYRDEDTFLFSYATNVSSLGIFVRTEAPAPPGTALELHFGPVNGGGTLTIRGEVVWINPVRPEGANQNPGMGIRFLDVDRERRDKLIGLVKRIAYLGESVRGQA